MIICIQCGGSGYFKPGTTQANAGPMAGKVGEQTPCTTCLGKGYENGNGA